MTQVWFNWLNATSVAMGVSVAEGGYIISLAFMIGLTIVGALATRGSSMAMLIIPLGCVLFFTLLGWVSYFVVLLFILLIAGLYARNIRGWFGG